MKKTVLLLALTASSVLVANAQAGTSYSCTEENTGRIFLVNGADMSLSEKVDEKGVIPISSNPTDGSLGIGSKVYQWNFQTNATGYSEDMFQLFIRGLLSPKVTMRRYHSSGTQPGEFFESSCVGTEAE